MHYVYIKESHAKKKENIRRGKYVCIINHLKMHGRPQKMRHAFIYEHGKKSEVKYEYTDNNWVHHS
jgi:hypothetical protein